MERLLVDFEEGLDMTYYTWYHKNPLVIDYWPDGELEMSSDVFCLLGVF